MAIFSSSVAECDRCKKQIKYNETKSVDFVPTEGAAPWAIITYKPGGTYSALTKLLCNECRQQLDIFLANPDLQAEPPKPKRRRFNEA